MYPLLSDSLSQNMLLSWTSLLLQTQELISTCVPLFSTLEEPVAACRVAPWWQTQSCPCNPWWCAGLGRWYRQTSCPDLIVSSLSLKIEEVWMWNTKLTLIYHTTFTWYYYKITRAQTSEIQNIITHYKSLFLLFTNYKLLLWKWYKTETLVLVKSL